MKSSIFASALLFAVSSVGAPLNTTAPALSQPTATPTFSNATITSSVPSQTPKVASSAAPTTTLYPSLQSQWKSGDPNAFGTHSNQGHISTTPWSKVNTAVYFNLTPEQAKGKTCKLVFRLSRDDHIVNMNANAEASPATFNIYRLKSCLNDKYSWNNRIPRDILAGVLTPKKGGVAEWHEVDMSADTVLPHMGAAPIWNCEQGEYSFEMVAADGVNVGWTSGKGSGLSIELY